MAKEIKLTQESLDAYKEELEYLKTTRADEVAEQLKEARSFGDLSENAEYDEAKNEQGKLYSRIAELEEIIKLAVVVTGDTYAADEISPGCRFIVKDLELDEEDRELIERCRGKRCIAVLNKSDLPAKTTAGELSTFFENIVEISAQNGEGYEELKQKTEAPNLFKEKNRLHCRRFFTYRRNFAGMIRERQRELSLFFDCLRPQNGG